MTAVYYPDGLAASDVLPKLVKDEIVVAGGLHKDIKDRYFRIGHMGLSVVDPSRGDLDRVIKSLQHIFG
ncbi:hypothetical protein FRB90_012673 [Tulasnella sp. 427]|nr:hypothetical protein FRB90_012673 [Tulasnella sp. 427]